MRHDATRQERYNSRSILEQHWSPTQAPPLNLSQYTLLLLVKAFAVSPIWHIFYLTATYQWDLMYFNLRDLRMLHVELVL